ncbi:MAG TPA: hypothetical protein VFI25_03795 [Planctomycetota bacterium]|nr:hypothetical protein [Planctomycetota bacterium]
MAWSQVQRRTAIRIHVVGEGDAPVTDARVEWAGGEGKSVVVPRLGRKGVYVSLVPRGRHDLIVEASGLRRVIEVVQVGERSPQDQVVRLVPQSTPK